MIKRFACKKDDNYDIVYLDNNYFKGNVCHLLFDNIMEPMIVSNDFGDVCIKDNKYEWIALYPDEGTYCLTMMFDENKELIEWYFDVSNSIGIENGIPYEEDLYLDMVINPSFKKCILDEDELNDALIRKDITKKQYNKAYDTLRYLEDKYYKDFDELLYLTNHVYELFGMDK